MLWLNKDINDQIVLLCMLYFRHTILVSTLDLNDDKIIFDDNLVEKSIQFQKVHINNIALLLVSL